MKKSAVLVVLGLLVVLFSSLAEAREAALYTPKDTMVKMWKDLCDSSSKCSYESIGKSIKGLDIYMFKIGNPQGGKVMFDGSLHGPEDCGTEIGYEFAKWVLTSSDAEAKKVLEGNYVLFIPIVNMDSFRRQNARREYTLSDGKLLLAPYGVDLNRNFVTGWGNSGSGDPLNDYSYRGNSAGSEPETKAVRNALSKFRPQVYMNTHCGMEMMMYAPSNALSQRILGNMTKISKETGTNTMTLYRPRSSGGGSGMAISDGAAFGASSWLFEIAKWENMPESRDEYLKKYYPKAFPVYLAMCKAVQKTSATCVSSWSCGTWSVCKDDKQTRVCDDVNNCASDRTETRTCTSACVSSWSCSTWSVCKDDKQTRVCDDVNNCASDRTETRTCTSACVSSWSCGTWSACKDNEQSRVCDDVNNCASDRTETKVCSSAASIGIKGQWELAKDYVDTVADNSAVYRGENLFIADKTYGSALRLDGNESYLAVNYKDGNLMPREGFTVDVKTRFDSPNHNHIIRDIESYLLQRVQIDESSTRFQGGVYSNDVWVPLVTSGKDLQSGRWYQVTYTYDMVDGLFKLYVDKALDSKIFWDGDIDTSMESKVIIGNREESDRLLHGAIRDLRIYNHALNEEQVAALS